MAQKKKRVAFRLRGMPTKPKRDNKRKYECEISGESVANLLEIVEGYGVDPADATIESEGGMYLGDSDYGEANLVFTYKEPEKDYQKRVKAYEKALANWQKWHDENEEEIKAEMVRREETERDRIAKVEEKAQTRAARDIRDLERQLARMKKGMK